MNFLKTNRKLRLKSALRKKNLLQSDAIRQNGLTLTVLRDKIISELGRIARSLKHFYGGHHLGKKTDL